MKLISKTFCIPKDLAMLMPDRVERMLFFDIETTGLSPARDRIYLIGCVYLQDGCFTMKQYFADTIEAEAEILLHFCAFSAGFETLVHFNGTTFDLPFIRERIRTMDLPAASLPCGSIDLYRQFKPLRKTLMLPNLKLKTLEAFLNVDRKDPYDGGQLIEFYKKYLHTHAAELSQALLLHNEEDLLGMPELLRLYRYLPENIAGRNYQLKNEQVHTYRGLDDTEQTELFLTFESEAPDLLTPFTFSSAYSRFVFHGRMLSVRIPLCIRTLKYFFPDYKNYYYLPKEDQAIHKSVAEFVDPSRRKKATAKTCYQNYQSVFLPLPKKQKSAGDNKLFSEEYHAPVSYVEYREYLFKDPQFFAQFLLASLQE